MSSIDQLPMEDIKVDAVLRALCEVPDDIQESALNGFISALRATGQDHVANIFRKESDKVPMSEEHYQILNTRKHDLCEFIDTENKLIPKLICTKVIRPTDADYVKSMSGDDEKAQKLIEILSKKSDDAFNGFIDALNETEQSHVTYLLTGVQNNPDKLPMSDEHRCRLTDKIDELCQFIDPENGLLHKLVAAKVIGFKQAETIHSVSSFSEKVRKLIQLLIRKSDDAFGKFICELNRTQQSHVTYILTGEGSSIPLKDEYREKLRTKRDDLVKMIDSRNSGLVTALMSKGTLSDSDSERVTSVPNNDDRTEFILDLIARKSHSEFFNFISALDDTGQTHVAIELVGVTVVAKIKAKYESGREDISVPHVDADLVECVKRVVERNEVTQLNTMLACRGVNVADVREGCVEVSFTCKDLESLSAFRNIYKSGELWQMLDEAVSFQFTAKGLKSLRVAISDEQFEQSADKLAQWIPMKPEHRKALLSSEQRLVSVITVSDDLLNKLPLCERRKRAIKQTTNREQQVRKLLEIVSRQPDSAFTELVNVLKDTDQLTAADIISENTNSPTKSRHAGKQYSEISIQFSISRKLPYTVLHNVICFLNFNSAVTVIVNI